MQMKISSGLIFAQYKSINIINININIIILCYDKLIFSLLVARFLFFFFGFLFSA